MHSDNSPYCASHTRQTIQVGDEKQFVIKSHWMFPWRCELIFPALTDFSTWIKSFNYWINYFPRWCYWNSNWVDYWQRLFFCSSFEVHATHVWISNDDLRCCTRCKARATKSTRCSRKWSFHLNQIVHSFIHSFIRPRKSLPIFVSLKRKK